MIPCPARRWIDFQGLVSKSEDSVHPLLTPWARATSRTLRSSQASHICAGFDCGVPRLNEWLIDVALQAEGRTARTFVIHRQMRVVGYYSLSMAEVPRGDARRLLRKDTPPSLEQIRQALPPAAAWRGVPLRSAGSAQARVNST